MTAARFPEVIGEAVEAYSYTKFGILQAAWLCRRQLSRGTAGAAQHCEDDGRAEGRNGSSGTRPGILQAKLHVLRWRHDGRSLLDISHVHPTIDEITAYHYRASASVFSTGDGVTPDWAKVREFVQGWIMPDASYRSGPFRLAGLWTPDIQDVRSFCPTRQCTLA